MLGHMLNRLSRSHVHQSTNSARRGSAESSSRTKDADVARGINKFKQIFNGQIPAFTTGSGSEHIKTAHNILKHALGDTANAFQHNEEAAFKIRIHLDNLRDEGRINVGQHTVFSFVIDKLKNNSEYPVHDDYRQKKEEVIAGSIEKFKKIFESPLPTPDSDSVDEHIDSARNLLQQAIGESVEALHHNYDAARNMHAHLNQLHNDGKIDDLQRAVFSLVINEIKNTSTLSG